MRFLVCLCHVKCLFAYFVYIYKDGIDYYNGSKGNKE